jgi:hypothetical protein
MRAVRGTALYVGEQSGRNWHVGHTRVRSPLIKIFEAKMDQKMIQNMYN